MHKSSSAAEHRPSLVSAIRDIRVIRGANSDATLVIPDSLQLAPNEIHLWQISLISDPANLETRRATLSPDEGQRAARFHFERDRQRFITGRGIQRAILGSYPSLAPSKFVGLGVPLRCALSWSVESPALGPGLFAAVARASDSATLYSD